ncbi:MAG: glycyl-radical enzyme activating protein [Ruminococcaceae bacterium]|nr:glycyl-radical enzyme activating protein [Oscillospiraceae bacterium]
MTGIIFDIKEFAIHDGGGVRTTVFLKGCPLRCVWCHNPEGQSIRPELMKKTGCTGCGKCLEGCSHPECQPYGRCLHACPRGFLSIAGREVSAAELAERLARDAELYRMSGGGVTISGGEPLMQADFCVELLTLLREKGIHTAIETCGFAPEDDFRRVTDLCDFVYCDLKIADSDTHRRYTGVPNELILKNIEYLRSSGKKYRLRTPLIPGITDTEENLTAIRNLTVGDEVEYLPYNDLAGAKYSYLGRKYSLDALE